MSNDLDDPTRDAAIRALCDFAEQPHPGRAGEAIDALERHLRASQPQPATGEAGREGPSDEIEWCQCGKPAVWPDHHNPEGEDVPLELCDACRKLQDDAFEAGLSHARSEAEAMRRFVDAFASARKRWNDGARADTVMDTLGHYYDQLPASLRPKKGTPDGK